MHIAQLVCLGRCRRFAHEVCTAIVLRECNHLANRLTLTDEHDHAVKAESQTTVRRCTEGESAQQMPELLLDGGIIQTQRTEGGILQVFLMDTDGTAAQLITVEDNVVGLGAEVGGNLALEHLLHVLGNRAGEGVVNSAETLFLRIPAGSGSPRRGQYPYYP